MQPNNTASLKDDAARAFRAAIRRADPALAMRDCLGSSPLPRAAHGHRTIVLALGKAAPAMLRAVLPRITGPRVMICVTHRENTEQVPGAEIFRAGHPVPDSVGAAGAARIQAVLKTAEAGDVVIALISGGGSALLPAPPEGVSLEDKQTLNRILLDSGLDIVAMNLIRQQVSQLKGGGLVRLAAPAPVTGYILSDVIGDNLRAIASGPTVAPIGTAEEARRLLQDKGLLTRLPESIQRHLRNAPRVVSTVQASNQLIGGNRESVEAAAEALRPAYATQIIDDPLIGNVNEAACTIFRALREARSGGRPRAILWGGETTVQVRGNGMGGRNQELALRVAALADADPVAAPWVFLSGGTDGRDGPTDAAGASVDQGSLERIRAKGQAPTTLLDRNDSNAALRLSGDLLITGATGTNVADVQILLIG
ncbi:glycerate kinase type-2 family protein [Mameliella sediminis]|uniref:glycerate kinase type-2 family protein n=1 Tax=Mameliella sediminis TaxID=2836866 RepID=UPI001C446A46|nr:DUF4147 domain-containing protein [Mameliella sediminis]MBV7395810.1 DUF4147 domain-containing protein [Mameliella sediminis]